MKKSKRIKLLLAILRSDDALLERVEALLNEPAAAEPKPEPVYPHDGWFREQRLLTFERKRAEREARETHIEHRNIGWREAQLPARWWQGQ